MAAQRRARTRRAFAASGKDVEADSSIGLATPFVAALSLVALLIFGLGLVPEYVVARHRVSAVLEDHRDYFTLGGVMGLIFAALYFALNSLS